MRNNKILKITVVLLSIFFVVSFGLSQIIGSDYFKNMFWASTALLAVSLILDLNAWSKLGLDIDKNKSKTIKRSFDDSTTLLVVFFGTLLCLVVLFDTLNHNVMKNNLVIIGAFIMTLEFELFMYLSVWNAKKDTANLLKNNK
ncbi:MAG: hypothetical protein IJK67_01420 [Bacilli bacterium]|nr:hypothetical protein [Bacilli bacterium]